MTELAVLPDGRRPYYHDERVTVWHARAEEVLPALPEASIDAIITDPPYNASEVNGRDGTVPGKLRRADGTYREVTRDFGDWDRGFDPRWLVAQAKRVLVDRGGLVAFAGDRTVSGYIDGTLHHMRTLVWEKTNPSPVFPGNYQAVYEWIVWQGKGGPPTFNGGGAVPNRYRAPIPAHKTHPNEKPLSVMRSLVERHTNPDDVILDPYGGSGTTARAAVDLGRRVIVVEAQAKYCDLIVARLGQGALDLRLTDEIEPEHARNTP